MFTNQSRTLRARSCEKPREVFGKSYMNGVGCILLRIAWLSEADLHMDDSSIDILHWIFSQHGHFQRQQWE